MSEKKNPISRDDGLDERLRRLGKEFGTPQELKNSVKSDVRSGSDQYNAPSAHVRRFTRAVLAYAGCVAILLGCVLIVPNFLRDDGTTTAGKQVDQPPLTDQHLTIGVQTALPLITEYDPFTDEPSDTDYPDDYYRGDLIWANEAKDPYRLNAQTHGTVGLHFDFSDSESARYAVYLEYPEKQADSVAKLVKRIAWADAEFEVTDAQERIERKGSYYALTATEIMKITKVTTAYSVDVYLGYQTIAADVSERWDPRTGESLANALQGMVNLNEAGMIDLDTLKTMNFAPQGAEKENIAQLFDTIDRPEEMTSPTDGQCGGIVDTDVGIACFFFALEERETLGAYVITTSAQVEAYSGGNPLKWSLYATNDPTAMEDSELDLSKWTRLDCVYDSKMEIVNCEEYGYRIDENLQGAYQYYCWYVSDTDTEELRITELTLYAISE